MLDKNEYNEIMGKIKDTFVCMECNTPLKVSWSAIENKCAVHECEECSGQTKPEEHHYLAEAYKPTNKPSNVSVSITGESIKYDQSNDISMQDDSYFSKLINKKEPDLKEKETKKERAILGYSLEQLNIEGIMYDSEDSDYKISFITNEKVNTGACRFPFWFSLPQIENWEELKRKIIEEDPKSELGKELIHKSTKEALDSELERELLCQSNKEKKEPPLVEDIFKGYTLDQLNIAEMFFFADEPKYKINFVTNEKINEYDSFSRYFTSQEIKAWKELNELNIVKKFIKQTKKM